MTSMSDNPSPDVEVGRFTLRTFLIDNRNNLRPLMLPSGGLDWVNGQCSATCLRHQRRHQAPDVMCSCGIYSVHSLEELKRQYPEEAAEVVAVIAPEGRCITGDKGLRSEYARVIALWIADSVTTEQVRQKVNPD